MTGDDSNPRRGVDLVDEPHLHRSCPVSVVLPGTFSLRLDSGPSLFSGPRSRCHGGTTPAPHSISSVVSPAAGDGFTLRSLCLLLSKDTRSVPTFGVRVSLEYYPNDNKMDPMVTLDSDSLDGLPRSDQRLGTSTEVRPHPRVSWGVRVPPAW